MKLAHALAAAELLRDELQAEVGRAREERVALRSLDGPRIQQRIDEKVAFLARADELQARLVAAVEQAAREQGLAEPTAEALARALPAEGGKLAAAVAAIRALSASLGELNALNLALAERALGCARAYVRAISPQPAAYGRLGGAAAPADPAAPSTVSRRA